MFGGQGNNKFTFGQSSTGNPAAAGGSNTSFSFGNTSTATPAASTSFSFGASATQQQPAAAATSGGGLFGSGTTGTATTGLFGMGSTGATNPLGGTTTTTQPAPTSTFSFGASTTAAAPSAPAAATSSPFSFGASTGVGTASTSTFGSLGAKPATTTTATTPASGGFSFGGSTPGGSLFGQTQTQSTTAPVASAVSAPASGGFSLGNTSQSGFSFGATSIQATTAATGTAQSGTAGSIIKPTFSFNSPASTGTGITSGLPSLTSTSTTTVTAAPSFGLSAATQPAATTTPAATSGFSFSSGSSNPATTNPNVKTSLSFGTSAANSSLPSTSSFPSLTSSLGSTSGTTAAPAANGLGGSKQPGITSFFSSTTTPLKTTATAPTGGLSTGTSLFNSGSATASLGTTAAATITPAADVKPAVAETKPATEAASSTTGTITGSTSLGGGSLFGSGSTLKLGGTQSSGLGLGGTITGSTGLSLSSLSTPVKSNPAPTLGAPSTPANPTTASTLTGTTTTGATGQQSTAPTSGTGTPSKTEGAATSSITNVNQLPNVLTISGPTLSPMSAAKQGTSTASGLTLAGSTAGATAATTSTTTSSVPIIKSNLPKDQLVPQMLVDCFENFKKNMEEIKKTKELNASFNNKLLVSNLNDINSTKQRLTQSKIELQRNVNEASKVKSATVQELRNLDICLNLKDMPVGSQYDTEIWNEYFLSRAILFENKIKAFKAQFEQLEGYFRAHDKPSTEDAQKLVEAMKITHKNLLNAAANLKTVNEAIEELKHKYTVYRRNVTGDMTNIFETTQSNNNRDENQQPTFNMSQLNATLGTSLNTSAAFSGSYLQLNKSLR